MGVQKISVTVDSEMLKKARRMAQGEAEHGPILEEIREEVRRKWLD